MRRILLFGLLCCLGAVASDYSITVNGELTPSIAPDDLRELGLDDDRAILELGRWRLILEKPGEYCFTSSTNEPGRLFQRLENKTRLIGISFHSNDGVETQDLSDLTPNIMHQLRGVSTSFVFCF